MSHDAEFENAFKAGDVGKMREAAASGAQVTWSHLALAAQSGSVERLEAILELGQQPTPEALQRAAAKGNVAALEVLVRHGVDVNAGPSTTALHHAAAEKQLAAADWLLAHGADVERRSESGRTPLQIAVGQKAKDVARRLVEAGARVGPDEAKALKKWKIEVKSIDEAVRAPAHPRHRVLSLAELEEKLRALPPGARDGALRDATLVRLPSEPQVDRLDELARIFGSHPSLRWTGASGECFHLHLDHEYAVLRLTLSRDDEADDVYGVTCRATDGWAAVLLGDVAAAETFLGIESLPIGAAWRHHRRITLPD